MFNELAKMGLGDMQLDLNDDQRKIVNKLGSKTRVLLTAGLLPVPTILSLATKISASAKANDEAALKEIEDHLNLGLRVAANSFPYDSCKTCEGYPQCSGAMEGIEPMGPEEAVELMDLANATTVGEA